ncbi:MAG: formyltetrahydrofolate deformylase [Candidatus Acidiferrales bacterium]
MSSGILLIDCPDRRGIVSSVAQLLHGHGANILHADQHQDNFAGMFFMRVEWSLDGFDLSEEEFREQFGAIALEFEMSWRLAWSSQRLRMAIFVSRYQHCLLDLLHRYQLGELAGEVAMIVSNHPDAEGLAAFYRIPFQHFAATAENRAEIEERQIDSLKRNHIDLVVLARYMQILSPSFVEQYPRRIINVHHSFLPAFTGAKPYHAAFQRGVKLIGATSHYVTEELDEGPIIDQDVTRVSHRDQVADLVQKGRDLERMVLARAVRWHLSHRILFYGNKTVVFD